MSFTDLNMYLVIAITMLAGIGITLYFVGALITVASAFGEKRILWGVVCILVLPLAILYCVLYWDETQYQRKYLLGGMALMLSAVLIVLML
jgi:endonuclease/exonuclease/phosphatase (EEP) superfamily protein YafD